MRIIITTQGENTRKELEDTTSTIQRRSHTCCFNKTFHKKFTIEGNRKNFEQTKPSSSLSPRGQHRNAQKNLHEPFKTEPILPRSETITTEHKKTKRIHLKLAKLTFPKRIADNYENDKANTENIIEDVDNAPELMELKQNHLKSQKYTLGEILGRKTVYDLKKKLIEEEKMKDKLTKINENNFRSTFENFTKLEKLKHVLDYKKIQPGNTNLIRFINQNKDDIDKCSLNKIVRFDNLKMFKANKICQSVFVKQQQRRILKDHLHQKIKMKHNQDRIEFDLDLKEMKKGIDAGNNIFCNYEKKKVNKMEKYLEAHKDTQNLFWRKFNCEHLGRRTNKEKMLLTNTDN